MLTGDKLETAENIALACKLIEEGYLITCAQELL
jgi:magnesium-transporting ATPase (P-type)